VTPAEVRRFFYAIPKDSVPYFSTEVEVGQIVLIPKESKKTKAAARKRAEELHERLLKGEDFETLAREFSEDPGSAKEGGNLGFWGKGDMTPNYEQTALKLKNKEISGVIESPFGYHIIQLIERKGPQYNSRHILIRPKSSTEDKQETIDMLDSLRNRIIKDSITFEKAAKKYSEDPNTKEFGGLFIDQGSNSPNVPLENLDPVIYFIIDTMKVGEISLPMQFRTENNKEAFRILFYKARTAPHTANLKDDYQKIMNACLLQKKQKTLKAWFEKSRLEVFVNVDAEYSSCNLFKEGF
jgi:peptidyl-prolyl cis-trans isomerase SurA